MAKSLREYARYLVPSWAIETPAPAMAPDEEGIGIAHVIALLLDASVSHVDAALRARFPSLSGDSELARTGRDRLIMRGRTETPEHYAARLRAWRYPRGHRVRGSAFAVLEQISEYFGGALSVWGIDRKGNRRMRAANGAETFSYAYAWDWDGGAASSWARQWFVIDGEFSGRAAYVEGECLGLDGCTPDDWRAIRGLMRGPHRWIPAGMQAEWLVVSLERADGIIDATPAPDGTWGKWGRVHLDEYIPARAPSATPSFSPWRFVALRDVLRDYGGDDDWAAWARTGLMLMGGDATVWPATITMLDGTALGGDASAWQSTIRLPDDGEAFA